MRALFQNDLKRRLAFSTVSQVSYITLGVAIAGPLATIGGVVHLVHQGLMKITLFFCAGNLAETLGIHKIHELDGVGRRMPWTMAAFTIGAFGMIGAPPIAGFISKWYLGLGALEADQDWIIPVLIGSSFLNAAYFLPVLHRAWFREPPDNWPVERDFGNKETAWTLLIPPLITALLAVIAGLMASAWFTPLEWVLLIANREFYQP
jgi:multicomponent Na+:H+ antiporter subunit D